MTRITTTVLVMMLLMNGAVTTMAASGLSEDLGVELAPGISDAMDDTIDALRDGFSPSAGVADTLFSLFIAATQVFNIVINAVTAIPSMFLNLGFPEWIVVPLFVPMYAISTFELIFVATGRDLV